MITAGRTCWKRTRSSMKGDRKKGREYGRIELNGYRTEPSSEAETPDNFLAFANRRQAGDSASVKLRSCPLSGNTRDSATTAGRKRSTASRCSFSRTTFHGPGIFRKRAPAALGRHQAERGPAPDAPLRSRKNDESFVANPDLLPEERSGPGRGIRRPLFEIRQVLKCC